MAFCRGCGAQVAGDTAFCPKCGKPVSEAPPAGHPAPASNNPNAAQGAGLEENVAGALSYLWLVGLIFLFTDKRPFVRFHAAQSTVLFGALTILWWIVREVFWDSILAGQLLGMWSTWYVIYWLLDLLAVGLGIFLMVKAYQHERFRVPVLADIADAIVGKVQA